MHAHDVRIVAAGIAVSIACSRPPTAGFRFDNAAAILPADVAARLGGPLTAGESAAIARLSRDEIARAFTGLSVVVTDGSNAFWRVVVAPSIPAPLNRPRPSAGESMPLGMLGGSGVVAFDLVSFQAIHYAPPGATRQEMMDAIARGVGRVAVHEFMHQMLGVSAAHNDADPNSYECGRPDRAAQYYGELRWTTAWPLLQAKFGEHR